MNYEELDIEIMSEILADQGVILSDDKVKKIVSDYEDHICARMEMQSYQHTDTISDRKSEREQKLEKHIEELENDLHIHRKHIAKQFNREPSDMIISVDSQLEEIRVQRLR
jgi:hypothetical protein